MRDQIFSFNLRTGWSKCDNPLPETFNELSMAMRELGYTPNYCSVDDTSHCFGLYLESYRHESNGTMFVVVNDQDSWEMIRAEDFPSAMELIRQYAPICLTAEVNSIKETIADVRELLFHDQYGMFGEASRRRFDHEQALRNRYRKKKTG